jgi:PAS domain S-box-containing protein
MAADGQIANEKIDPLDLRTVINSTPGLIHTSQPDGYLDFFNQTWLRYVGEPLERLLGWKWTTFIHPDDVEGIVEKWRASLASGEPFLYEARVLRADGEYRWMLHHKVALHNQQGEIVKWHGSSIDIEDRKRAEEQLRRSTQELQKSEFYLAEGERLGHTGSWAFGPAGFDYWSAELFQMYGLAPRSKAPTFQEYLDCIHPQDREFMASLIQRMLSDAAGCDVTKRILRPNGELRYIRCVGCAVVENGTLQRIAGTAMDVTDHELLTQELRRREAYLAEAQRLSHTGSFGWNPDTGEIVWSDETYRIFEFGHEVKPTIDLVGQRVHPQDRADFQKVIDGASQGATDFEHTYRLLLPDGRVKHVHAIAHATRDKAGRLEYVGAAQDVTRHRLAEDQRKEAAEALQASERDLRSIIGTIPTMIWSAAPDGSVDFFNPRWLDYTGLSPDQSRDWRWTAPIHPDDLSRLTDAWQSILVSGEPGETEVRLRRFDGAYRWFLFRANPLRDESGNIVKWYGINLDIEDRKRAEEALQRSESYLAEAQRLSHTGSWAWTPDTDVRHWSEESYRVLGFDPRDGLPRTEELIQRIHPDDQPAFRASTRRATHKMSDEEVDYRIVHPGGAVRDIHSTGHPVFSPSGDLVEFVGTVIDITERKAAEEKIREQEAELRQMLDLTPQHVAVFGPAGERLYANRVTLDYIGLSLEEWLQTAGGAFRPGWYIHPDDREKVARVYSDATRSSGSAYDVELRIQGTNGSYRWFLARFNPLHDDKGQVTRWYVASTDIEDRKRTEEKLQLENAALREEIDQTSMFEEIVGTSPALQTVLSRISKVAPSDSTVLVTGETGTGKELVARAIHKRSQRSGRAFVSVNCAAIPRDLIASELFGHEKGAFTGAMQRRLGRFEMADGGTIFLDEVGELSPDTQVALLRVLQEREFERVGGGHPIRVDVRVIAATNRDLEAAVANGTLRQDLFYRLNVFPIEAPPLRERKDDILMLVEYFAQRYASRAGKTIRLIEKKTLELLQSYQWPGNIRELQNVVERSVILSSGETLSVDELWLSNETSLPVSRVETLPQLDDAEPRCEREIIEAALVESKGRVSGPSGAAVKLGIPPSTLDHRIKALKIHKQQFKFR